MSKKKAIFWLIIAVVAITLGFITPDIYARFTANCPQTVEEADKNSTNMTPFAAFCKFGVMHSVTP